MTRFRAVPIGAALAGATFVGAALVVAALSGCARPLKEPAAAVSAPSLAGSWRSSVQFKSGAFASIHDLEFLYVFNEGGTMTESSNYDGAPPVPPAYGVWRRTGPGQYEAKYEFYATKAPAAWSEIAKGGGWTPAGRGELLERITLSGDGRSFTSTIRYDAFDASGKPAEGGGEADGKGARFDF